MTISNKQRHYALAILTITYVFNFVDRQLLAILLEPIKTEFGVSDSAMGLLYGLSFALFYATLAIPVARLADKGNRRNILAAAAGIWSIMTVACGFAANFGQMVAMRIGVAVGEAGGLPPSQSMVNDLYPPEQRARAMAVFSSAVFIGTIVAMVGGALLAQSFGWRTTFIVVGAPGVILALLVRFTIREPVRGAYDTETTDSSNNTAIENLPQPTLKQAFVQMWATPALRFILLGCACAGMAGYALGYWAPAFMMRVHELSLVRAGVLIGGLGAITGLIGSLFGAWLCDRFAQENRNWLLFVPAISLSLSLPLMLLFLYFPAHSTFAIGGYEIPTAIAIYCIASFTGSWWAAPTFVAIQEMVAPNQRTLVCAILLLVMNLIGFGCGPLLVGIFSDLLTPLFGIDGVRYALMLAICSFIPATYFYFRAGRLFSSQRYNANN